MIFGIDQHPREATALISPKDELRLSYGDLAEVTQANIKVLADAPETALALLCISSNAGVGAISAYLACLESGLPTILCEDRPATLESLIKTYQPSVVLLPEGAELPENYQISQALGHGYTIALREGSAAYPVAIHPELALCLSTSGSTGNAKLVRLSRKAVESNADSIREYLQIGPAERAIQSLPIHYSYGLSVLNSHLAAGASFVLSNDSFMRPELWATVESEQCTSFAGVPYMYEVMHRLRYNPAQYPSLRTITQAGGPLKPQLIQHFSQLMTEAGGRMFVMYGQTEATARISFTPPEMLDAKLGSIGIAIPGGRLWLEPIGDEHPGVHQLCYEGANVMLGYAETPEDLALGDEQGGVLITGDLARVDEDGYFFITGRLKRFAKVFGKRISLVDIEHDVETFAPVQAAAIESQGGIKIFVAQTAEAVELPAIRNHIAKLLEITPAVIKVEAIDAIPLTSSGKKNYNVLSQ